MTTAHRQIANAVQALLLSDPPLAGGRVFCDRKRGVSVEVSQLVVVRLERSASMLGAVIGGRTSWATLISLECYGRGEGQVNETSADALVDAVFDRLASDTSLGGLAMDVELLEGDTLTWDFDEFDTKMECITAKLLVRHQTTARTLKND